MESEKGFGVTGNVYRSKFSQIFGEVHKTSCGLFIFQQKPLKVIFMYRLWKAFSQGILVADYWVFWEFHVNGNMYFCYKDCVKISLFETIKE